MKSQNEFNRSFRCYHKISILVFLLFLLPFNTIWSQCANSGLNCQDATPIDFPFGGLMNDIQNSTGPIPGCNGNGILHNGSWYSFVPTTSSILIEVIGLNCNFINSTTGYQVGIFPDCDPNSFPIDIQCDLSLIHI